MGYRYINIFHVEQITFMYLYFFIPRVILNNSLLVTSLLFSYLIFQSKLLPSAKGHSEELLHKKYLSNLLESIFPGVSCHSHCPRGFYGESCSKKCDCKNNGSCNFQTGKCVCERGWHGADCNTPCRAGKYGVNCNQDCPTCVHGNGTCHPQLGTCVCKAGWRGPRCDRTCAPGTWGVGCANTCKCRNGAGCNHETGEWGCHIQKKI